MAMIVEDKKAPEQKEKTVKPKVQRKTADKWKKKAWYTIVAPPEFESKELAETIAEKPEMLIGRIVNVTGRELANQPKKQHVKIMFKVGSISGNRAHAEAIGHYIKDDFMRRTVRRRSSKVMSVKAFPTKDGATVKIKTIVVTEKKTARGQRASLLKKTEEMLGKIILEINSKKIVDELVFGTIPNKVYPEIRKIVPIKRIEITKSLLVSRPSEKK